MGEKIVFPYKDKYFDSQEEVWFAMWCQELKESGFIQSWERGNSLILTNGLRLPYIKITQLKTKIKTEGKILKLLSPSEYTSDLIIKWTVEGLKKFVGIINTSEYTGNIDAIFFNTTDSSDGNPYTSITYVEVKPTFDQNNMTRLFVNNQKFIWDKHKLFVNLIYPEDLFKQTFMPAEAMKDFKIKRPSKNHIRAGKKAGDWKTSYIPKTLNEFLNTK